MWVVGRAARASGVVEVGEKLSTPTPNKTPEFATWSPVPEFGVSAGYS